MVRRRLAELRLQRFDQPPATVLEEGREKVHAVVQEPARAHPSDQVKGRRPAHDDVHRPTPGQRLSAELVPQEAMHESVDGARVEAARQGGGRTERVEIVGDPVQPGAEGG